MDIRLSDHFDGAALQRGLDYARRGLVVSVDESADGALASQVSNGRGTTYHQRIALGDGWLDGDCSCPIGHNCKHVAAVLMTWAAQQNERPGLAAPVQGWLRRVTEAAQPRHLPEARPEDYPDNVKDRLLYVLSPHGAQVRIDICKGRINAAGTGLNKSIRRYDAAHALRSTGPAKFIRPLDLELLSALAQARLWDASYSYGLPDLLRPKGQDAIALIRRLCDTGRFLHDTVPGAQLNWSEDRPAARLAWRMAADGRQRLSFVEADGQPLHLRSLDGAALWVDPAKGRIGALEGAVDADALQLVEASPDIAPNETEALGVSLPDTLAGLDLPRPRTVRQTRRKAKQRVARLILGRESARDGPRFYGTAMQLPTLTLRFVYDGQEVAEGGADPQMVGDGEIVTLTRDSRWEAACATRLMEAGALPVEELEIHWPGERMMDCDFVFADGEMNLQTLEVSDERAALDFAFHVVPELRRDGWEVIETPTWPYRLSEEAAELTVTTEAEAGEAFQGNDWFSLGFQAEIGGKPVDVAPLVAAFLEQIREDWDEVPDVDTLRQHLIDRPVYLDRGKAGYVALDLSPLAPLLHLFLTHHTELGALHPSDANVARLAEEALAGSGIRFADNVGILPLARSLQALAEADSFEPPEGLTAQLRSYQAYGAAWMGTLLEAGFGGVLADDMGLGKTVQTLALLQARREAGAAGPALLIVPTSLLYGWQAQAMQFTPDLRLVVLHGPDRAALRDAALQADLVMTTYPLLARDRDWLAAQDWPLVILDEAQTLKNPASQMAKTLREIPARGRLALTGTPLENSLQDLWTLIDWVNPGLLGDRKRFQALFRTPIEKHGDAAAQARLNRRLRPFMLRRTKEAVATELPPRTEILDRVDLPKPQQALYETVRSAMDARVREAIAKRGAAAARITVLDALLKLRQVCCDPALVKTEAARSVTDSAKRARLRDLLGELVAEGRRVLVFSQFVEMLRLIEADLAAAGISHLTLTGQTQNRAQVLDSFAQGEAAVFLLSLKAGGVGLTLTEADTVILYDPWWNPAVERQAMDRTHRIGQDKPVFVHRLVAAGTVEEKILDMQARKQALADALFDEDGGATETLLDEATLQDLFAPLNG
ncbi:ATP-dependent helicase HepA [Jannaschia seosinensis]|uniref:ATP-dependent helicase HepA n=1 Tax=Jannaschia seosinensis TaxID=313367 RepID=A0A0M7B4W7_9RHOB|nr:DEAD/DEAH box helicase [Jannaschia seosinensis]CUH07681.1 ATP-dependent helicase HepA [Jannaschia seosinensis]